MLWKETLVVTWTKTECDFSSNQQRKGFNQIIAANAVFNIRKRGDKGRDPTTAWRLIETSAKEVITAASQSHVTHRPNVVVKSQHLLSLNLEQGTDFTGPFPKGSFQVMFFNNCIDKNQNKVHFEEGRTQSF